MRRPSHQAIGLLLLGSGLSALLYQTAWQRMLALVFGATTAASAATLAVFLGGLGLGGAVLGAVAEKKKNPLRFYADLEIGVSVSAALSPFFIEGLSLLYFKTGGSPALGDVGATVLRLFLSVLALGPTAFLMGGTLPAAARAAEAPSDLSRSRLAVLYAVNTFGAVLGSLVGTLFLFETFGTRLSLFCGALLNLLVALLARSLSRGADLTEASTGQGPALGEERTEASESPLSSHDRPEFSLSPRVIYSLAGIVGVVFLGLELVWYRMLSPLLGGTTFTFGMILATALSGIGGGSYLYSRRGRQKRATPHLLATTLLLEAVFALFPLAVGDDFAVAAASLQGVKALGFPYAVGLWALLASSVVLLPALVAGYQFPVLISLLGEGREKVAIHIGRTYAFNTGGSILGSLSVGFVLLPSLGAVATWKLLCFALLSAAVGTVLMASSAGGWRRKANLPLAVLFLSGVVLGAAPGPSAAWRHSSIGVGRSSLDTSSENSLKAWLVQEQKNVAWEVDGRESTVGMHIANSVGFVVNGKNDGNTRFDRATQVMSTVLGALLHPAPADVFVVGLGTGMSAGWTASLPDVDRVVVAELEPAILKIARAAETANQQVLDRGDVEIFLGDAREYLLTTDRKFDLIFSEPSNPYRAGIASLFTREMYQNAKGRLRPGGYYLQWLQGYEIDAKTVRTVLKTLRSVFGEVEIWHTTSNDLLLLCSETPIVIDLENLRRKVELPAYREALRRAWHHDSAEGVLSRHLLPTTITKRIAAVPGTQINTDDANVLEYSFARTLGGGSTSLSRDLALLFHRDAQGRPRVRGEVDWDRVYALSARDTNDADLRAFPRLAEADVPRALAVNRVCFGDNIPPREEIRDLLEAPDLDFVEQALRTLALAEYGDESFRQGVSSLRAQGFSAEALLAESRFRMAREEYPGAAEKLLQAVPLLRSKPLMLCNTPERLLASFLPLAVASPELRKGLLDALLRGPFAIYLLENERRKVAAQIAALPSTEPQACLRALGSDLLEPHWNEDFLKLRYACLLRANHPERERAGEDLVEFLEKTPGRIGTGVLDE